MLTLVIYLIAQDNWEKMPSINLMEDASKENVKKAIDLIKQYKKIVVGCHRNFHNRNGEDKSITHKGWITINGDAHEEGHPSITPHIVDFWVGPNETIEGKENLNFPTLSSYCSPLLYEMNIKKGQKITSRPELENSVEEIYFEYVPLMYLDSSAWTSIFHMLKPGGYLIIAGLGDLIADIGFIGSFLYQISLNSETQTFDPDKNKRDKASLGMFSAVNDIKHFLNRVQINLFFGKGIDFKDIPQNKKEEWIKAHGTNFFKQNIKIYQKPLKADLRVTQKH